MDRTILDAVGVARYTVRRGGKAPQSFVEPGTILHEMRVRKGEDELAIMRRAAAASLAGHEAGMRATRPGLGEWELEAIIEYHYRLAGAQDVAYPSIVAGGANATILHYNTNRDVLRDGDLVLVDSGAEVDVYASDVTRTWPVNGKFSPEQRAIYEIVLRAQKAGIERVRAGESYNAYHEAAVRVLTEGLVDVGLLSGSIDALIEENKFFEFYPHRTGHWIGLDVHDAGRYKNDDDAYRTLEPGMVLTVEPGLYVQPDQQRARALERHRRAHRGRRPVHRGRARGTHGGNSKGDRRTRAYRRRGRSGERALKRARHRHRSVRLRRAPPLRGPAPK